MPGGHRNELGEEEGTRQRGKDRERQRGWNSVAGILVWLWVFRNEKISKNGLEK